MKRTEWIRCPVCGGKTRDRIREDTVLKNYPLYCPKYRQEALIDVVTVSLRFFFCRFLSECAAGLFPLLFVAPRIPVLPRNKVHRKFVTR